MPRLLISIQSAIANMDPNSLLAKRQVDSISNSSDATSNITSYAQFSHGLAGVNIDLDNQSSRALYIGIGILLFVVTFLRLLQRTNAHLRLLTTYGSKDKQHYWALDRSSAWAFIKKYIVYAPLSHIRHNKEIQLSKAVNIGTLPGRLHFILLFIFIVMQITFMTMLDFTQMSLVTMAELRGRSGHLAIMNMIALFVMGGRNNPFIRILRVSFDTFNLFHRWIGRIVVIESIIHTVAWAVVKVSVSSWVECTDVLFSQPFLTWGFVSTIALVCILLHSPSPIRHAFYETFLCLHQLLAFVTLLGIFYHVQLGVLPQYGFMVAIVLIWSFDRLCRLVRLIYINISFKNGITKASVEALPGNVCRVTFHTPRAFTPRAGSHIYAYFPSLGWWQSHPFSVAWTTTTASSETSSIDLEKGINVVIGSPTTLSLIVSARTGITKKLYDLASKSDDKRIVIRGLVEGPYGSLESLHSYGTVLLFAGGVGITHHLPHIRDLVQGYSDKTISTQKVVLIWTVPTQEALKWVQPWMDEILCMPQRRELLDIRIYVTRGNKSETTGSKKVKLASGRPNIDQIVLSEFKSRIGAMCVGVCGPGALADDVRCATRMVVDQGKVDLFEEAFTW